MTAPNQYSQTPFTLVVADIHLQPEQNHPINQAFLEFLQNQAAKADALYILGDLFEMWVGDDIGLQIYATIIDQFKSLNDNGLSVYLLYGNRDFLMRDRFFQQAGIQKLEDIEVIELYQTPYLMLHGDSLCTDDKGYQKMRKYFRKPWIQWLFLNLCKKRRIKIGEKMRGSSKKRSQQKSQQIMDINKQAMLDLFHQHPQVQHMIHGHTHRPAIHQVEDNAIAKTRWVLGDWRLDNDSSNQKVSAKIIKVDVSGPQLLDYP